MSTLTLPAAAPSTRPVHDFNPVVHHYYNKSDLAWSAHTGGEISAICGDLGVPHQSYTGQRSNGVLVVCPLCSTVYAELPTRRRK